MDELGSGYFDERLLRMPNFLLILSPDALNHCGSAGDWLRREIEHAMGAGRNIVPIFDRGFVFPFPVVSHIWIWGGIYLLGSGGYSLIYPDLRHH